MVGMLGDLLTYQALAPQGLWFRKNLSFALYAYLSIAASQFCITSHIREN